MSDRAVIYVDSGKAKKSSNYVIKIQIGEDGPFNRPVRIDVAGSHHHRAIVRHLPPSDSGLSSSGQSSPRTPPPNRPKTIKGFGSETSESETESDISAENYPNSMYYKSSRVESAFESSLSASLGSLGGKKYGESIIVDENGFHLNEFNGRGERSSEESQGESLSNFAGYKDIFSRAQREGTSQIMSEKGTIRGVKNRVRDGIATFLQSKDLKDLNEKEQGRMVVYVTSMGVVRDTFQRCSKVKQIFRNLLVKFDERDCYMNEGVQDEIRERLSLIFNSSQSPQNHILNSPHQIIQLPQVFIEGQYLGDADTIEKLNETGELRELLRPYKSVSVLTTCDHCGGFRMLPCPVCNGSKKSVHRNHFTEEFIALKCMHCDQSGLVKCQICNH